MAFDMLDRLTLDPGTRTLGELLQEREWAVTEIRLLRVDIGRNSRKEKAEKIEKEMEHRGGLGPKLHAQRLLRMQEVSMMVGLKRPSIYRYVSEENFPAPIMQIGLRTQRHNKAAAAVIHGDAPGIAAVTTCYLPDQGQPQSVAGAVVAVAATIEGREKLFELCRRWTRAVVPHLHHHSVTFVLQPYLGRRHAMALGIFQ